MFKLNCTMSLITVILLSLLTKNAANKDACVEGEYNAPGTATHPLGDENLNNNILQDPIMNEGKETKDDFKTFKKCPSSSIVSGTKPQHAHIPCPEEQTTGVPKEIIYSSDSTEIPQVQCKRCDIRLTEDSSAVLLRCYDCYDMPIGSKVAIQKMTLPQPYTSVDKYLEDAINFLKCHQWIYNSPNTHILANKCLDNILDEWIEYSRSLSIEQFKNLSTGLLSDDCPNSLNCLLNEINDLKPLYPVEKTTTVLIGKRNKVNPKKMHEIVQFAHFVNSVTTQRNVQYIIDIGSGLGYLSQYLFEQYNYKVLGIEGSEKNVQAAISLQEQLYPKSKDFVKYKHIFVTEDSAMHLLNCLQDTFPEFNPESNLIGIIGLHACADLGVCMLHIFETIASANCLLLMPCCYHRMKMKEKNEMHIELDECFLNFPLSNVLKELFIQFDATKFLRRPFLRLASQQADSSWSKLNNDEVKVKTENCLFRAILQHVCEEEQLQISRKKRKTGCTKSFSIYDSIDNVERNFSFRHVDNSNSPVCIETVKSCLLTRWLACHERDLPAIEIFCVLQNVLQGVCENVVLLDRVQHMRELRFGSCQAIKITDQHISPRCYAIVAFEEA